MDSLKQIIALLITFFSVQGEDQAVDLLKSIQTSPDVLESVPQPLPEVTCSGQRHTTDDFRRIIIHTLIPRLKEHGVCSFTGSQARKFIEQHVVLTEQDLAMHTDSKSRWRSLLSQALQSVAVRGYLYKRPGKTRTYYIV